MGDGTVSTCSGGWQNHGSARWISTSRGHRTVKQRTVKRTALTALAALSLTGAIGCSQQRKAPTAPVAFASAPAPERLTPDVARQAFRAYTTNEDVARASGDER